MMGGAVGGKARSPEILSMHLVDLKRVRMFLLHHSESKGPARKGCSCEPASEKTRT